MKPPKGLDFIGPAPFLHQAKSVQFGISRPGAGLFLEMGLGKTRTAIDIARYRLKINKINRVLIVCPTVMLWSWQREINTWSEYNALVCHSLGRDNRIALLQTRGYKFYITNYDTLWPYLNHLQQYDMIIWDESSRYLKGIPAARKIKKDKNGVEKLLNPSGFSSDRSGASVKIADQSKYRLILTGTPVAHNLLNIWTQFRVMDLGETYGLNYYSWRNYYFSKSSYKWAQWKPKKSVFDNLQERMYINSIRFTKQDVLPDLPDKLFSQIPIPISGKTQSIYEEAKTQIINSEMENRKNSDYKVTMIGVLSKLIKMSQITAGFVITDGNKIIEIPNPPKLNALHEFIEIVLDNEESLVIGCRFLHSIELIKNRLKKIKVSYVVISGDGEANNGKIAMQFQEDNSIPIAICQIGSGIGIELFKKKPQGKQQHLAFYEQEWELDKREQFIDRIHRIGQKAECNYVDFFVQNTVDEYMLNSIKDHKNAADELVDKGILSFL